MSVESIAALQLKPNLLGFDPRDRSPWGSGIFFGVDGLAITENDQLLQYFFDADGYVLRTINGEVVHVDDNKEFVVFKPPDSAVGWDIQHPTVS
jgi:hypothetical protein